MAKRLSRYFGVPAIELRKRGAFNAFLGIDNRLFVDPKLLTFAKTPEFKSSRQELETYFSHVIRLLDSSRASGDVAWKEAGQRLRFSEEHGIALGYSRPGGLGTAIGWTLGTRLLERAAEIVRMGVRDPVIFELIGLFEEDFGADRLSDMTIAILRHRFLDYTQRMTKELTLKPSGDFELRGVHYILPLHPDGHRPLLFTPTEILDVLPIALDFDGIERVASFNAALRAELNKIFTAATRQKVRVTKTQIRGALFSHPTSIAKLAELYRAQQGQAYDFERDPLGLFGWDEIGRDIAAKYPLELKLKTIQSPDSLRTVVEAIIRQFKKNIEENRLSEVLYDDDGKPRHEVFSQRLFYAVADAYCEANNLDLSREPNAGNGPVDFKVSSGYKGRFLVEIKLSSNSRLLQGFEKQLPAYGKSEASQQCAYVVLRVTESDSGVRSLLELHAKAAREGKKVPGVHVIDARPARSASRR